MGFELTTLVVIGYSINDYVWYQHGTSFYGKIVAYKTSEYSVLHCMKINLLFAFLCSQKLNKRSSPRTVNLLLAFEDSKVIFHLSIYRKDDKMSYFIFGYCGKMKKCHLSPFATGQNVKKYRLTTFVLVERI